MLIENSKTVPTRLLNTIMPGEVFKYNRKFYMKGNMYNSIEVHVSNLEDGFVNFFNTNTLVEPIKAKLIIE